jgi:hypothetical protein
MSFRVETIFSFANEMNRDRRRKKKNSREEHMIALNKTSWLRSSVASEWTYPLWYPLAEIWNDHVIPIVLDKFAFSCSIFSTVVSKLSSAREGSALYQATYAVGCAHLAKLTQTHEAISSRVRAYGNALSAMNMVLQDPRRCKNDSTLLGVWLLGIYEVSPLLWTHGYY